MARFSASCCSHLEEEEEEEEEDEEGEEREEEEELPLLPEQVQPDGLVHQVGAPRLPQALARLLGAHLQEEEEEEEGEEEEREQEEEEEEEDPPSFTLWLAHLFFLLSIFWCKLCLVLCEMCYFIRILSSCP